MPTNRRGQVDATIPAGQVPDGQGMTTFRVAKRDHYTRIDNRTLNDERLSYRARGVLAWLLSKPDDWTCNSEAIAAAGTEGRDAIRTALNELVEAGYLVRRKVQVSGGRWATVIDVHERPGQTDDGLPGVGKPVVGFSGAIQKTERQKTETKQPPTLLPDAPSAIEREFEAWYRLYPRHVGKGAARKAYAAARKKGVTAEALTAGAEQYAARRKGADPRYTKHPSSWLSAECWLDEPEASTPSRAPHSANIDTDRSKPSGVIDLRKAK